MTDEHEDIYEHTVQREEMEKALNGMEYNKDLFQKIQKRMAEQYWTRYKALVDAGFEEYQAFEIILKRGMAL